jgi:hypothetical protein
VIAFGRVDVHGTALGEPSRRRVLRVDETGIAVYSHRFPELLFSWSGKLLTPDTSMPEAHLDPDDLAELRRWTSTEPPSDPLLQRPPSRNR